MQQARTVKGATRNETIVERTGDRELVVTRTFNAPAHIVFDASTKPELLKRWWGPSPSACRSLNANRTCAWEDLPFRVRARPKKPGGVFGAIPGGQPPSRLVLTQVYERMAHVGEAVVTATFEESQGRTRLTLRQLFPSKEALEGALASGMERGMRVTLDQLDELVASM